MNLCSPPTAPCNCNLLTVLLLCAFFLTCVKVESVTTMRMRNGCRYTVWPAVLTGSGTAPSEGGFMLKAGQSTTLELPRDWSGRLWGRTGCNFLSSGAGRCETGDCAGKLDCTGVGATPPATLIEFTMQGTRGPKDFYDVSLVDGFNLPVSVAPTAGAYLTTANRTSCGVASCPADLNRACPSNLQVANGEVVGCKSACLALGGDMYCCSGAYANPNTCKATSYSRSFKSACPAAYTYAFDDPSSLFTCSSTSYSIIFCPSSSYVIPPPNIGSNCCTNVSNGSPSLTNALATFNCMMYKIFWPLLHCVGTFFDDMIVFSKSEPEHLRHLRANFEMLQMKTLIVNEKKREFFMEEIHFLQHIVLKDGFRMDLAKIKAIQDWLEPVHELVHVAGKKNVIADALSRRPHVVAVSIAYQPKLNEMQDHYSTNEDFAEPYDALVHGKHPDLYSFKDGFLMFRGKLCVS
ncbi:hypothetical protein L7F22_006374 [Adiantum nelumboides]|nr:hypothetical protein [Adiantum nelumboides]